MKRKLQIWHLAPALVIFAAACTDSTSVPLSPDLAPSVSARAEDAAPQAGASTRRTTLAEALRQDARSYAAQFGVGIDEAVRRLQAQEQQGNVVARLRSANRGRFAGLWVEHQPEFRIVVRLAGTAPVGAEFRALAANSPTPVTFVTGATATQSEVLEQIHASLPRFSAALPGLMGTDVDVQTGEIVLTVFAVGSAAEAAKGRAGALSREVGHPVRVELVDAPVQDQQARGGANLSTCTSGFVVANSAGTRGITTAGHCGPTQTYFPFSGTSFATTYVAERWDADQDVQWHTTATSELPEFYADLTSSARVLTGRRLRSSTAVGNTTCHRGRTTGYSCGSVSSTTYQPTYAGACNGATCTSTYITVTGPNLACAGGDSGGPWFNGQTAFGIHKAGANTGTGPGQCSLAVYMSTDYLSGLGVSLVYGT